MKVSVITATWNSADTIADALISLREQDYPKLECIVIDGQSRDATLDIVRSFEDVVTTVVSEKDSGIYDALNKGISLATGDVVGFLHSDDILAHSSVISHIVNGFSRDSVDAVFGDLQYVSKDDTSQVIRYWKSGEYSRKKLMRGWMPPHPTFYMKKECYDNIGAFDLSFKIAADYDAILRYYFKYKIISQYIPEVLVKMRLGGVSNRSLRNIIQKSSEDFRALVGNGLPPLRVLLFKNIMKVPQLYPQLIDKRNKRYYPLQL